MTQLWEDRLSIIMKKRQEKIMADILIEQTKELCSNPFLEHHHWLDIQFSTRMTYSASFTFLPF